MYSGILGYSDEEVAALKDKMTFETLLDPNPTGTKILSMNEAMAYEAPFPDSTYKAGFRRFPEIVMFSENGSLKADTEEGIPISKKARKFLSEEWTGDSFMAIGQMDPILVPAFQHELQQVIKGCPDPMPVGIGHFVQEKGDEVAKAALEHFGIS